MRVLDGSKSSIISIHALLAESDHQRHDLMVKAFIISIHALLAESDVRRGKPPRRRLPISIHALLAESDCTPWHPQSWAGYFYPRSPCGERPALSPGTALTFCISIHALLAESDLRVVDGSKSSIISIHALLAESDSADGRQR